MDYNYHNICTKYVPSFVLISNLHVEMGNCILNIENIIVEIIDDVK